MKLYYVCGQRGLYDYTCIVDQLWKAGNIRRFVERSTYGHVLIIDATALCEHPTKP